MSDLMIKDMREDLKEILVSAIINQNCFIEYDYGNDTMDLRGDLELLPLVDYLLANFNIERKV